MVVAVSPTSVPGDAEPAAAAEVPVAALVAAAELLAALLAGALAVELLLPDELHAATSKRAARTTPKSAQGRTRDERP
jgi:hypothetical protein